LLAFPLFRAHHEAAERRWRTTGSKQIMHSVIRGMLNYFVTDLIQSTAERLRRAAPQQLDDVRAAAENLIGFSVPAQAQHLELKQLLRRDLYTHDWVLANAERARSVVTNLFRAFYEDPQQLQNELVEAAPGDDSTHAQAVADYVAGMTDRFAISEHRRLFGSELFGST
jgi:dGTPase